MLTTTVTHMRSFVLSSVLLVMPLGGVMAQGSAGCRPTDATRRTEQRLQALTDSLVRGARDVPAVSLTVFAPKLCLEWSGASGVANRATGEADAWEQQILLDFEKRQARGEKPENLEHAEIVQEPAGRFFRYMKALPTAPVCATCHGQNLSEGVKAQLATEYPGDRAADYPVGSVRGAVSIKKGL